MSDIDIIIGNARVQLCGKIRDGSTGRNKTGATSEDFIVDDVLHAVSRMMSAITDHEIDSLMQTQLTYMREIHRAASKGICGYRCENHHAPMHSTCRRYWERRGRFFSDATPTTKESRWTPPLD